MTTNRQLWPATVCCALYVGLAMAIYGFGSFGQSHMVGLKTNDSVAQIWWLGWVAQSLPHIHRLFLTQAQNYPFGQNFGVNGSMLALGVLFAPITKLFGPVVTFNLLLRLALAASATSMCFVLRRWVRWWPAAFVGGLLYGFSAYTSNYGSYLFLIFVPLPPLVLLLLHECFVRQQWRPRRTGITLGLLLVLQYFIWVEVLAGTVVIGAVAVALTLIVARRRFVERWRYAVTALTYTLGVAGVLLAYPIVFTFTGPQSIKGPPQSPSFLASLNGHLLSPFIASSLQWIDPGAVGHQGADAGNLLYLGLPLVLVLVCFAVFLRSRTEILFAGAMALGAFVLSLGSPLTIDGHATSVPLPFTLLAHLPALSGFEARRFAIYTDLFAAAMFALGMDELWTRMRERQLMRRSHEWSKVGGTLALGALVVAVALPLVPSSTQATTPTNVPTFFTTKAADEIPSGSVVLAYPYPDFVSNNPLATLIQPIDNVLLDQAVAGVRFKLIGGFGWFPSSSDRGGTSYPAQLEPSSVQALFDSGYIGETSGQHALLVKSNITKDLRMFLRKYSVQTVLVVPPGRLPSADTRIHMNPTVVTEHVTAALGPPTHVDGVTVWFHVRQRLAALTP